MWPQLRYCWSPAVISLSVLAAAPGRHSILSLHVEQIPNSFLTGRTLWRCSKFSSLPCSLHPVQNPSTDPPSLDVFEDCVCPAAENFANLSHPSFISNISYSHIKLRADLRSQFWSASRTASDQGNTHTHTHTANSYLTISSLIFEKKLSWDKRSTPGRIRASWIPTTLSLETPRPSTQAAKQPELLLPPHLPPGSSAAAGEQKPEGRLSVHTLMQKQKWDQTLCILH